MAKAPTSMGELWARRASAPSQPEQCQPGHCQRKVELSGADLRGRPLLTVRKSRRSCPIMAYRDGPTGQNAEGAVAPNCQGGRSTNLSVARLDTCFDRALGAVGEEAAERFGEAFGGNVGEAGSSVSSPAAAR
jgi:hypothetical protein